MNAVWGSVAQRAFQLFTENRKRREVHSMATIVRGIGSSHSPALLMEPRAWLVRAERDDMAGQNELYDFSGTHVTYDQVLEAAPSSMADEVKPERLQERHEACQRAIAQVAEALDEVQPDLVVVIGDDHREVYHDDNMPAMSVYWGETIPYKPQGIMKWPYDPSLRQELWYPQDAREYPVDSERARRLIEHLVSDGFDIAHSHHYRPEQAMSHSFGFVFYKLMPRRVVPMIPVNINTYYPPNQVTPRRAFQLGQAIRKSIESWQENMRVVVMATGGLSHFVIDEAFDRAFLDIMAAGDIEGHAALPPEKLQSGNSEFRCWSTLGGAVAGMKMNVIDYIPCYRSIGGTGCAMAFATWS
jgi:3-O-methylgallate 3,4-dioxygenase